MYASTRYFKMRVAPASTVKGATAANKNPYAVSSAKNVVSPFVGCGKIATPTAFCSTVVMPESVPHADLFPLTSDSPSRPSASDALRYSISTVRHASPVFPATSSETVGACSETSMSNACASVWRRWTWVVSVSIRSGSGTPYVVTIANSSEDSASVGFRLRVGGCSPLTVPSVKQIPGGCCDRLSASSVTTCPFGV